MSLDTLIPHLEDPEVAVAATDLTSLSYLSGDDRERFLPVWRGLSIQRRRDVVDRLADLIEDNIDYDFSSVFKLGLVDDDVQVRADSIKALWEYEEPDLPPVLLKLLADPEALVRAEAALGLGRFLLRAELDGENSALINDVEAQLRSVASDEAELPEVRGRALEAVGVRSHDWVRDLIDDAYASGERRLEISAVHAMGRNADPNWLPTIIEEMLSEDGEMRFEAAMAAGALGDEEAVPALAELTDDEDPEVQEAAIGAMGEIGGTAARNALNNIAAEATDERILEAVADALNEADFIEDPLGVRLQFDRGAADDDGEDDE